MTTTNHETIEMAMARTETPEEKRRAREEQKANMVASRRAKAYRALVALPIPQALCSEIVSPRIAPDDLEDALTAVRAECRKLATTDEHEVNARLALDALGALWAVL